MKAGSFTSESLWCEKSMRYLADCVVKCLDVCEGLFDYVNGALITKSTKLLESTKGFKCWMVQVRKVFR